MKKVFIRFGLIPLNERSKIYRGDELVGEEIGVSVYEAIKENGQYKIIVPKNTENVLVSMSGCFRNKNCYEVKGNVVGVGSDNEPLLNKITVIKKIYV